MERRQLQVGEEYAWRQDSISTLIRKGILLSLEPLVVRFDFRAGVSVLSHPATLRETELRPDQILCPWEELEQWHQHQAEKRARRQARLSRQTRDRVRLSLELSEQLQASGFKSGLPGGFRAPSKSEPHFTVSLEMLSALLSSHLQLGSAPRPPAVGRDETDS